VKPDSGTHALCVDPACGLCAATRAIKPDSGERWPSGVKPGFVKPDSGEREVCGAIFDGLNGKQYSCNREAGHADQHVRVDPVCWPGPENGVTIPLSLAQRILAALSAIHDAGYQALAAELRERVPR
jgi:hypothetical protein